MTIKTSLRLKISCSELMAGEHFIRLEFPQLTHFENRKTNKTNVIFADVVSEK